MTRTPWTIVAMVTTLALASPARATLILNGSFEDPDRPANSATAGAGSNWTAPGSPHNPFVLDNTSAGAYFTAAGAPNGEQVVTLRSGTGTNSYITQQLNYDGNSLTPVLAAAGQSFAIRFNAGRRTSHGTTPGTFTVFLQDYVGGVYQGVNFAQQSFFLGANDSNSSTIDLNVAVGDWSSVQYVRLTIPADLNGGTAGHNIRIAFADAHGTASQFAESSLDAIAISQVPEPSTFVLLGLGLASLAARRRNRK